MRFPEMEELPGGATGLRSLSDGARRLALTAAEARIRTLRQRLLRITTECADAGALGRPGQLYFLLRKKWQLMQELFQAENNRQLLASDCATGAAEEKLRSGGSSLL
jgi:hypothetical protein